MDQDLKLVSGHDHGSSAQPHLSFYEKMENDNQPLDTTLFAKALRDAFEHAQRLRTDLHAAADYCSGVIETVDDQT